MLDRIDVCIDHAPPGVTPLRGRDPERDHLVEAFTRSSGPGVCGVVFQGERGLGRSRLLQEASTLARRLGVRTVTPAALGAVDRSNRPVAMILDDLDLAAPETITHLADTHQRPGTTSIIWIISLCPARTGPEHRSFVDGLCRAGVSLVSLEPLPDEVAMDVVRDRLGAPPSARVRELAAQAAGNPGLIAALVDGLVDGQQARLPASLLDHVGTRLADLPDETARLVRVASALGASFTAAQAARMLGWSPAQTVEPIEAAIGNGVLTEDGARLRFRHELVRGALMAALPESVRRGLRRQAATVLLAAGSTDVEVAEQLADGAEPGDRVAAARIIEVARGLTAWDAERAAELAHRAVQLLPVTPGDGAETVAVAIDLLHAAGRDTEAEELGLRALAQPLAAADVGEVRLRLSALDDRAGFLRRTDHNRRALRHGVAGPRARARHLAWLAYNLARDGRTDAAFPAVVQADRVARAVRDKVAMAVATVAGAMCDIDDGDPTAAARRLRDVPRLGETDDELRCAQRARLVEVQTLATLGRVDAAARIAAEELDAAERFKQPWRLMRWSITRAWVELLAGRVPQATRHAANGPRDVSVDGLIAQQLIMAATQHAGEPSFGPIAADRAAGVLAEDPSGSPTHRHACWLQATATSPSSDAALAARLFRAAVHAGAPADPAAYVRAARVARAAHDSELAREVTAATARWLRPAARSALSAVALHVAGLIADDAVVLAQAVDAAPRGQWPLLRGAALEDLADHFSRTGRRTDATAALNEAHGLFDAAGADASARRVDMLRGRVGATSSPPRSTAKGWESLTDAELRVARVVSAGATNRQAASQLYLSPHTVSSHLRSAFSKLGINSRVELARVVLQHDGI